MTQLEVFKGDYRILKDSDETIVTKNLGSGLCVCVRDIKNGLLGLCHLVVPKASKREDSFPVFDCLEGIRIFFKALIDAGAEKQNLDIWLIGVGQFLECPKELNIGAQAYTLVKKAIEKNGLSVKGEHVGGPFNRSVSFSLENGPTVTVPGVKKGDKPMMMDTNQDTQLDFTLEYIFEQLNKLPTFPKAVQRAIELIEDPKTTTKDLVEVLRFDPAITTNILKITNSARFGLQKQVTNLDTALALLGHDQTKDILMASGSLSYLSRELYGYGMKPEDLWYHSIATGICTESLCDHIGFENSSLLFTAAILHDIGKIVLNLFVGAKLGKILELATKERFSFAEAEWMVLGADHAIIGSEIMRQWNFPHDIVRAVRNHHDPDLYIQDKLSALLALSNIIVTNLGVGVGTDGFRYRISPNLLEILDLKIEDIYDIMFETQKGFMESQDILELYKS